jgi:hypothetical protein
MPMRGDLTAVNSFVTIRGVSLPGKEKAAASYDPLGPPSTFGAACPSPIAIPPRESPDWLKSKNPNAPGSLNVRDTHGKELFEFSILHGDRPSRHWFAQEHRFRAYQFAGNGNGVLPRLIAISQLFSFEVVHDLVVSEIEKIMRHGGRLFGLPSEIAFARANRQCGLRRQQVELASNVNLSSTMPG